MDLDEPTKVKYRLLSVGDVLVDEFLAIPDNEGEIRCELDEQKEVISFPYGRKISASSVTYSVGGNAANNAVGIGRMGIKTLLFSTIGDDWTNKLILDTMAEEGVGTFLIASRKGEGARGVIVNYHGERTLFSYHPDLEYKLPTSFPSVEWVYLTSMGGGYEGIYSKIVEWVKGSGLKLAFNPGTRQLADGVTKWGGVLAGCDVLFVNKEEAGRVVSLSSRTGETEPKRLLEQLGAMGPKVVVITDGANGAYARSQGGNYWSSIFEVPVVETTGAGDAFGTGFLAALIEGKAVQEALKWGMVESASVVSKIGAEAGLLTRSEFEKWLGRAEKVVIKEI